MSELILGVDVGADVQPKKIQKYMKTKSRSRMSWGPRPDCQQSLRNRNRRQDFSTVVKSPRPSLFRFDTGGARIVAMWRQTVENSQVESERRLRSRDDVNS